MWLPLDVSQCIEALEGASFPTYAVGGCVRDSLLGLAPHDFDLCTAALPEEIQAVFHDHRLVLAGVKHGTVGVVCPNGVVEITTFRTEGGYDDCRHPGWVKFVPAIEEDLARRDFTINAMAWSPTRGFADPFGGQADLKNHILRAVGDPVCRFQEDALRILRGARFAAKYRLTIDGKTEQAMFSQAYLMENLAPERVFDELCKLLPHSGAEDLLYFAPIITQIIPELAPAVGFDQRTRHHVYDLYTHIAHVTAAVPGDLTLRWAALLHDVGKLSTFSLDESGQGHFYGHAKVSAQIANEILLRLKAPTALREQVVLLIEQHMVKPEADRKFLRRRLSRLGSETLHQLLTLQRADMGGKGTGIAENNDEWPQIDAVLSEIEAENACLTMKDLAVNGRDLMALGFAPGKALGDCLKALLEQVVDERLPNEKDALLAAAKAQEALPHPDAS
jgi:tRNA nucleotidyltransferase (CCA-adding enzyme)